MPGKKLFKPGQPKPPGSGRAKGTRNVVNQTFRDILGRVVSEPENEQILRDLRYSDDATDRRTYWTMAAKFVPQLVEAKLEHEVRVRIIDLSDERTNDDADDD